MSARNRFLRIILVITVCAVLLGIFTPACSAQDAQSVSVQITVGPCIHINIDGTVRSNVSTITLEDSGLLTTLAL